MDWQNLITRLAPLRRRWDVAVLANLPEDGRWTRPTDLRDAINAQAGPDRQISWKVLDDTLRRLVSDGYIGRKEMANVARETRYWLLPPGQQLITGLGVLEAWYDEDDRAGGQGTQLSQGPLYTGDSDCAGNQEARQSRSMTA
jgi:DNA-binding HxlR family transcriptional regulator